MPPSACSSKPNLASVEMVRTASAGNMPQPGGAHDYFYDEKNFPLLFAAQLELIAQAMICNAAPVIGLMPMFATCDFDFGFANAPGSHHLGLSHTMYLANNTPPYGQYNSPLNIANLQAAARAPFATAQKWFMTQLVTKVVSMLATTDDPAAPGTKVLDNTLIYVMSEIGDGQDHTRVSEILYPQTPDYLPLITIGKAGRRAQERPGRAVPDRRKEHGPHGQPPGRGPLPDDGARDGGGERHLPGQTGVLPGVLT